MPDRHCDQPASNEFSADIRLERIKFFAHRFVASSRLGERVMREQSFICALPRVQD